MTDHSTPPPNYSDVISERFGADAAGERYREADAALLRTLRALDRTCPDSGNRAIIALVEAQLSPLESRRALAYLAAQVDPDLLREAIAAAKSALQLDAGDSE